MRRELKSPPRIALVTRAAGSSGDPDFGLAAPGTVHEDRSGARYLLDGDRGPGVHFRAVPVAESRHHQVLEAVGQIAARGQCRGPGAEPILMKPREVRAPQGLDRVQTAAREPSIWMIPIQELGQKVGGYLHGLVPQPSDPIEALTFAALDFGGQEIRLERHRRQDVEGRLELLGQRAHPEDQRVVSGRYAELETETIDPHRHLACPSP